MNKINLLLVVLLASFFTDAHAEKRKILFIGNSYTAVNDLPNMVKDLALSFGDTLEIDSNAPGGVTLNGHTTNAATLAKIQLGGWDYVVLQAQSQEPSFDPSQVASDTYPYAKILDSLIHVSNPCAETIFYITWGRKNGDASNCAAYPPVCTYNGMQQRLRESYLEMTMDNNATCAPAGVAWKKVRDTYPTIELYNPDESHPSLNGTYLVACTFYSTIYHKTCAASTYMPVGISTADAFYMQTIASNTVLDSLENWQQYGSLPRAAFSSTNIQSQYSFTNQSLRSTQYEWNFGDGSAINTTPNPIHNYTAIGTYTVTLKAKNTCGKYDLFSKTISVTSVLTGIENQDEIIPAGVFYTNKTLTVMNNDKATKLKIYDMKGALVYLFELTPASNIVQVPALIPGVYFYNMISDNKSNLKGKFAVN